jgi:hypothetical protein
VAACGLVVWRAIFVPVDEFGQYNHGEPQLSSPTDAVGRFTLSINYEFVLSYPLVIHLSFI